MPEPKTADVRVHSRSRIVVAGLAFFAALIAVLLWWNPGGETPEPTPEPTPTTLRDDGAPTEPIEVATAESELFEPIALDTGIDLEVVQIDFITVDPQTPGEVEGEAATVTVEASNTSPETQDISSAVVTLVADDGTLAIPTTAGPNDHFSGSLEPDDSVEATYVFMLDDPKDRGVTVSVQYGAGEPVATFTGPTS